MQQVQSQERYKIVSPLFQGVQRLQGGVPETQTGKGNNGWVTPRHSERMTEDLQKLMLDIASEKLYY